jgi:CopG family transcriptional regulator/antitoxin EndoAI
MSSASVKRINITLPQATLRLLDRVAPKGDRSKFINEAVHAYVETKGRERLKAELKAGARARASRDLALTSEWFALDEKTWPRRRK